MALTADQWHILAICLFPVIDAIGIGSAVFLSSRNNKLLLSTGVLFSAGVLLSGALVHMLAHSTEILNEYFGEGHEDGHHEEDEDGHHEEDEDGHHEEDEDGHHEDEARRRLEEEEHDHPFPWSYTIFSISFLLLLCIEVSVERYIDNYFGDQKGMEGANQSKSTAQGSANDSKPNHSHPPNSGDCVPCDAEKIRSIDEGKESDEEEQGKASPETMANRTNKTNSSRVAPTEGSVKALKIDRRRRSAWAVTAPRPSVVPFTDTATHLDLDEENQQQTVNPWVAILLTFILSIHVLIEGLTLGSTQDVGLIKSIFIAVVIHKGFSAFSLGSSLIAAGWWNKDRPGGRRMFFVLSGIFICTDILGLGIGIALGNNNDSFSGEGLANGVLLALLGGSFLFVSAVELIPGEFEKSRVFKLPIIPLQLALLGGFGLMALIGNWV